MRAADRGGGLAKEDGGRRVVRAGGVWRGAADLYLENLPWFFALDSDRRTPQPLLPPGQGVGPLPPSRPRSRPRSGLLAPRGRCCGNAAAPRPPTSDAPASASASSASSGARAEVESAPNLAEAPTRRWLGGHARRRARSRSQQAGPAVLRAKPSVRSTRAMPCRGWRGRCRAAPCRPSSLQSFLSLARRRAVHGEGAHHCAARDDLAAAQAAQWGIRWY